MIQNPIQPSFCYLCGNGGRSVMAWLSTEFFTSGVPSSRTMNVVHIFETKSRIRIFAACEEDRRHTFHTVYLSLPDTPKTEVAWIPMNPESTYSTATCVILDHSVWWTTLLCSSLLSTSPPLLRQMMMLYRVVKMIRPWSIVVLSICDAAVPPNESTTTPPPPPYQWRSKRHCRLYHNMS